MGGVLLGVLSAAYGVWAVGSGVRGRWLGRKASDWELLGISGSVLFVMFGEWAIRLIWETGR